MMAHSKGSYGNARALLGRLALLLAALALLSAGGCAAQKAQLDGGINPRTATFDTPEFNPPEVEKATLAGGAQVFMLPDHDLPLVRVYMTFAGGELHDPEDKQGLASMAGALWRTGGTAGRTPEEFDDALEQRGVEIGIGLGREGGSASLSVLSKDLDYGLGLFSEIVLTPGFDPARLELTRAKHLDALRRERDDPQSLAFKELRKHLYPGHPRGRQQSAESLESVTREDVMELQGALVAESKWVIGVVGDFEPGAMLEKLNAAFGELKGESSARFELPEAPAEPEPAVVVVPKQLTQTTLVWAALAPGLFSDDRVPLDVADYVLGGGGFQSRLTRSVRIERGLAYSVGSFYSPLKGFGVIGAYASTATESTGEVYALMGEEIERAGQGGFSAEEVQNAAGTEANRYIFRFRDPADLVLERMNLALWELPEDLVERFYQGLSTVTPVSVDSAARGVYSPGRGVWVLVGDVDPAAALPGVKTIMVEEDD